MEQGIEALECGRVGRARRVLGYPLLPERAARRRVGAAITGERIMKHFIALSLCSLTLGMALPALAQVSPAPEASAAGAASPGNAAGAGVTGNDGSAARSDGADSRSHETRTPDDQETKPQSGAVGDKTDYSGNEGTDTESTGMGTGHGTATQDADSSKQTKDSGSSDKTN